MYQRIQNLVPGVIKELHKAKIYHTNFLYRVFYNVFNCFFLFLYPSQGLKSDIELSKAKESFLSRFPGNCKFWAVENVYCPKSYFRVRPGTSCIFIFLVLGYKLKIYMPPMWQMMAIGLIAQYITSILH